MESAALPSSEPKQVLLIAVSWSCKCLTLRKPTIKTHHERWLTPPALHSTVRGVDVFAPCHPWAPVEFPTSFPLLKWGWRVWADERVKAGERRDAQVGSSSPRDSLPVPARFCSAQPFPTGSSSHQPGPWGRHCCKLRCLRPRDRRGDTAGAGGGGRYRLITHGPFVLRVATSSSRLHPAPPPLPGRRALDEEEAPGPGRVHVYLVFPGRREAMHVVTAGQGVPRRHPRGSVMALQRQTRKADILPTGSTEA